MMVITCCVTLIVTCGVDILLMELEAAKFIKRTLSLTFKEVLDGGCIILAFFTLWYGETEWADLLTLAFLIAGLLISFDDFFRFWHWLKKYWLKLIQNPLHRTKIQLARMKRNHSAKVNRHRKKKFTKTYQPLPE